jgi:hypothetical protein
MTAKIILKHEEKEYLLQRTPENSLARSALAEALPDENQPALVVFTCNEQTAYAVLQIAERHCGCAWRVMHYQMARLGLLNSDRSRHTAFYQANRRNPEYHLRCFDDPAANGSHEMPQSLGSTALYDHQGESSTLDG